MIDEKVTNRQRVIVEFSPKAEELDTKKQKFVTWLAETEKRLKDVPDLSQITIEEYDQELKVCFSFLPNRDYYNFTLYLFSLLTCIGEILLFSSSCILVGLCTTFILALDLSNNSQSL